MIDENTQIWSSGKEEEAKLVRNIPELRLLLPLDLPEGDVGLVMIGLIL